MRLFDMDSKEDYLLDGKYKVATPYAPLVDVVEVVRCKDCVHGTDRTEEINELAGKGDVVNPIACMMYSNDGEPDYFPKDNYCGFGERIE